MVEIEFGHLFPEWVLSWSLHKACKDASEFLNLRIVYSTSEPDTPKKFSALFPSPKKAPMLCFKKPFKKEEAEICGISEKEYERTFWGLRPDFAIKDGNQSLILLESTSRDKPEKIYAFPKERTYYEFLQQCNWNMENSMGIGLSQLFGTRIAPYIRVQETMFTHGMIELLKQVGIKGILNYYAVIPFDTTRPLINPRLTWNQQFGLINFQSIVSEQKFLMIPMYGFGDIIDHLSIEKWLKFIRSKQKSGDIEGHALVVLNHDMDSPAWKGTNVPRFMRWMPNIGGIREIIKAVDKLEYVKLTNLLEIIPK